MRIRKRYNMVVLDSTPVPVDRGRKSNTPEQIKKNIKKISTIVLIAALSLVIVVTIFVSVLYDLDRSGGKKQGTDTTNPTVYEYSEKDSLTVLIALTDDDMSKAEHFVLMRIDPARYTEDGSGYGVCFMSLSPELVINGGSTLAELFSFGGTAQCALELKELCGSRGIKTATINYQSLLNLVNTVGGVNLVVEYDINYRSPDGSRDINTAAGNRTFTGGETARLLYYPEWPGGVEEQRLMICRCFASMSNKLLRRANSAYLDYYFNKIISTINTNVSAGDYQVIKEALYRFSLDNDGSGDITKIYLCQTESDEQGRLVLSENGRLALMALYGEHE